MKRVCLFAVLAAVIVLNTQNAEAATVGYWQLQDGAPASTANTATSTVNNGALEGAGIGGAGGRTFNGAVPGAFVLDGVAGPIVNTGNSASLSVAGGAGINVPFSSLLEPNSWTFEYFFRAADGAGAAFPGAITRPSTTSGTGLNWGLGFFPGDVVRTRIDTTSAANQIYGAGPDVIDGSTWHHAAIAFNGTTNQVQIWVDYVNVSTNTITGTLANDGVSPLRFGPSIGFNSYTGLMDEVRMSDSVLNASQFLRTAAAAEVSVTGNALNIADGDNVASVADDTDFGTVLPNLPGPQRTFTVTNESATDPLFLSDLTLPAGFQLVEGLSSSLAPLGTDTFTVELLTGSEGVFAGNIQFLATDLDENIFSFAILGEVAVTPEPTTGLMLLVGVAGLMSNLRRRRSL